MKKEIVLNDQKYILEEEHKNCFNFEEIKALFTEYFLPYDYVLGDYSYNKLRLKGFYHAKNKNVKSYNNVDDYKQYLEEYCAKECPYFLLKREKSIEKSK